jgi:hypothetical protein
MRSFMNLCSRLTLGIDSASIFSYDEYRYTRHLAYFDAANTIGFAGLRKSEGQFDACSVGDCRRAWLGSRRIPLMIHSERFPIVVCIILAVLLLSSCSRLPVSDDQSESTVTATAQTLPAATMPAETVEITAAETTATPTATPQPTVTPTEMPQPTATRTETPDPALLFSVPPAVVNPANTLLPIYDFNTFKVIGHLSCTEAARYSYTPETCSGESGGCWVSGTPLFGSSYAGFFRHDGITICFWKLP